jgi:tRNA nucleotidyltransferase (CCA-adding enzyme)
MKTKDLKKRIFEKSCGAILFKRGEKTKFLLLKYLPGHWGFARGHVEKGESEEETARREVEEETGIRDIKFLQGFRERARFSFRRKGRNVQKQVVFFLGEVPIRAVKISSEHLGYLWLTYSEAMKKLTYGSAKRALKKARGFIEPASKKLPKSQTQTGPNRTPKI